MLQKKLERAVKTMCGREARLERFGSSVCGFSTVHSDLDLTIIIEGQSAVSSRQGPMKGQDQLDLMKRLSKSFRFQHGMRSYAVLGARVPVIKLQDPQSGVSRTHVARASTWWDP